MIFRNLSIKVDLNAAIGRDTWLYHCLKDVLPGSLISYVSNQSGINART